MLAYLDMVVLAVFITGIVVGFFRETTGLAADCFYQSYLSTLRLLFASVLAIPLFVGVGLVHGAEDGFGLAALYYFTAVYWLVAISGGLVGRLLRVATLTQRPPQPVTLAEARRNSMGLRAPQRLPEDREPIHLERR